jgi:glycine/D-amino acid oxidase-like deaminating enzyme
MSRLRIAILGGGLAGSFLAWRLAEAGQRVLLADDAAPGNASRVAAGLFNIITGRFGAKSWMGDTLLASLRAFFEAPGQRELASHLHFSEIYRPFQDVAEFNKWSGRAADPAFRDIVALQEQPLLPEQIENPWGGIRILPCGWADTRGLISGFHRLLAEKGVEIWQKTIDYQDIDTQSQALAGLPYDRLVFAEGYRAVENPWFSFIPLIPNKGELLYLHAADAELPFVLSKKIYLLPLGGGRFACGSTYQNHFSDLRPSAEGREAILAQLRQVWKVPAQVEEHLAGVRPTTPDRKPAMGAHPSLPNVYFFGGFGTKGLLIAPHFSARMARLIIEGKADLPPEVQLNRWLDPRYSAKFAKHAPHAED